MHLPTCTIAKMGSKVNDQRSDRFNAIVVRRTSAGVAQAIEERRISDLPPNEVVVNVKYSSLNYKDCMSYMGNLGVTRRFPHTPGLDAVGIVTLSNSKKFRKGDAVIVTSHALGMSAPGGFGEFISCPADWLLPLPDKLTMEESMIYGTAGLTAAFAVNEILKSEIDFSNSNILVSGATGGVGLISIAILSKLGIGVTALTTKRDANELLTCAGAKHILNREVMCDTSDRGLLAPLFDGAIDTVGGNILSNIIKCVKHEAQVITTGIVNSQELKTSLLPFILRGIRLVGVNTEGKPPEKRREMWEMLATHWKPVHLHKLANHVGLNDVSKSIENMLAGRHSGRTVIDLER